MNDVTSTGAAVPASEDTAAATASAQVAAAVEQAVEETLVKVQAANETTLAQKQTIAFNIYTTWRNQNLRGLPPQVFAKIDAVSASLIAAIAAEL